MRNVQIIVARAILRMLVMCIVVVAYVVVNCSYLKRDTWAVKSLAIADCREATDGTERGISVVKANYQETLQIKTMQLLFQFLNDFLIHIYKS